MHSATTATSRIKARASALSSPRSSSGRSALRSRSRLRSVPSSLSPGSSNRNRAFIRRHNPRRRPRVPSSPNNSPNGRSSLSNRNRGHVQPGSSRPNGRSRLKTSSGPNVHSSRNSSRSSNLSGLSSLKTSSDPNVHSSRNNSRSSNLSGLSNSSNNNNKGLSGITNRQYNVRSNRRDHGSNRKPGCGKAAGKAPITGNRIAHETGLPIIGHGHSAAGTADTISLRPASACISAASITSASVPYRSCTWDIRASSTADTRSCS